MQSSVPANRVPKAAAPAAAAFSWVPDLGDGTFKNPVIFADYSDPDVVRVGEDFYLTSSSFNCTPGLPILHSRDLVNWTIIGHAVKNLPHPRYAEVQPGCGIWAPAIRFHAGRFWIFFPMPDDGIYVTTAAHPTGPWSEPHLVQAGRGLIDPCPLWDDDGQAYLVHAYAKSRSGINNLLRVRPMAPDGSRLLGEGQIVFHEPARHPTIEGPKFLKRNGWYYILAPAGGVATGWQVALRSRNIFGPYEDRVVLEQGGTEINGPHQGALVDTPGGDWWFVHFQDAGVYGRILHLQPARWQDDWPILGHDHDGNGVGEPVARCRKPVSGQPVALPQTSDEFDSPRLGLQWQWHANHREDWLSLSARPGWLRLFGQPRPPAGLGRCPSLLLQKLPASSFVAETSLEFAPCAQGEEAGLIVTGRARAAITIRRGERGNQIVLQTNTAEEILREAAPDAVTLRMLMTAGGLCRFSFEMAGGVPVAAPTTFQATPGEWIGAKVGIFCAQPATARPRGCADFEYFRVSAP